MIVCDANRHSKPVAATMFYKHRGGFCKFSPYARCSRCTMSFDQFESITVDEYLSYSDEHIVASILLE